jgi:hypothetical protein
MILRFLKSGSVIRKYNTKVKADSSRRTEKKQLVLKQTASIVKQ